MAFQAKVNVPYPRQINWWPSAGHNGHWYELSTWCNEAFGQGNWDYINQCFLFEAKEAETLFKLKWL